MNFLISFYFSLPNFSKIGIFGKVLDKIIAIFFCRLINFIVIKSLKFSEESDHYGLNRELRPEQYIVSLTTIPSRLEKCWIAIDCILRQTFKPDKVILWLSHEQIACNKMPQSLLNLIARGLTIEYCDDLKSHKKYFFTAQKFPDANIITIDDDLIYGKDVLKNLFELHSKFPNEIAANRAHKITFNKNGELNPYKKWKHHSTPRKSSHLLFHTSGAGILIPPKILPQVTFNKDLFMRLSPKSDDVWLKCMAFLGNHKVVTNGHYNKDPLVISDSQKDSLVSANKFLGLKDIQFKNVLDYFMIDPYLYQ